MFHISPLMVVISGTCYLMFLSIIVQSTCYGSSWNCTQPCKIAIFTKVKAPCSRSPRLCSIGQTQITSNIGRLALSSGTVSTIYTAGSVYMNMIGFKITIQKVRSKFYITSVFSKMSICSCQDDVILVFFSIRGSNFDYYRRNCAFFVNGFIVICIEMNNCL